MLASSAAGTRPGTSGQHLSVLLFVLAQHLGHRHQGLDLGHLLADVHQLSEVRLTNVVNSGQVPSWITLELCYIMIMFEYHALTSYLDSVFIWIRFVSYRREMIKKDNHPLFVLEDERVDHLHVGLLASKFNQICKILKTFSNHHQRSHGCRRYGFCQQPKGPGKRNG